MTDNELIATFMEFDCNRSFIGHGGVTIITFTEADCRYKTSWDWLMPVVRRIKIIQDEIHFDQRGTELIRTIDRYLCLVQIEDAFMYIVEFIKLYNQNK